MPTIPDHLKKTDWTVCPECGSKNVDHDSAGDLNGDCGCEDCGWQWPMYVEKK